MMFQFRHVARVTYPTRHIVCCEDDLYNQVRILTKLASMFEPQGHVQVTVCSGSLAAAAVIQTCPRVDLVILDHDMPEGNGSDLIEWMRESGKKIPIITFSGITENNQRMSSMGAEHLFSKDQVIQGAADAAIRAAVA